MLLVGLGSNLRLDGTAFGIGNTTMVSAGYSRRVRSMRFGRVLHRGQSVRNKVGFAARHSDCNGISVPRIRGLTHSDPFGQRRLAAGDDLHLDLAVFRLVR